RCNITPLGPTTEPTRKLGQHRYDAFERFPDRGRVVHQRDTDAVVSRIHSIGTRLCEESTRHNFDTRALPKSYRSFNASSELAHIEPQEEAALRPAVTKATRQNLVANVELAPIGLADCGNMLLLGPNGRRGMLHDTWHLGCYKVSDLGKAFEKFAVTSSEARAQSGQVGSL